MTRTISYDFTFSDGVKWSYKFEFDQQQRLIPVLINGEMRRWTALDFEKCPNCPLKSSQSPQCPVARNLDHIVEDSKETISHTRALVTVTSVERTYSKECATQEGLRSLFGLIMACSGCPHLDWLRPLARFHLPFADPKETLYRVLSLQFVDSYLKSPGSNMAECLKELNKRYAEVEKVNHAFIKRIRTYCKADADKNALAALDVYAQFFTLHREQNFEELRGIFS